MSARQRAELDVRKKAARNNMHKEIKFRNDNQRRYYRMLCERPLVFAIGPAGTGKTFLAASRAVELWAKEVVDKIILVRPAVESEENLGYLPGTLDEKLEPYLTPLHDALNSACTDYKELQQYIEVAPLAYMRGRTFNNCVVLVDEAQNITVEQMLMLMTRMGHNCFCFVMGDPDQGDLIASVSGLDRAVAKMGRCFDLVAVMEFGPKDIVRSRLVQAVYEFWYSEDSDGPTKSK